MELTGLTWKSPQSDGNLRLNMPWSFGVYQKIAGIVKKISMLEMQTLF